MIPVTKPFTPPIEEYQALLQGIWQRNWLTNNGPLVKELEEKLRQYLGIDHLLFVSNGTIAIQLAIKALGLTGEVITTPFSFVATTSSLVWEGCKPVFVDIDPESLNIDPLKIEAAITEQTQAILATHCFGNPCDVEEIDKIAKKYGLKVIYDAAHCFGTQYKGKSIFEWGDVSTTSFHATKLFHTIEGGAVFAKDAEVLKKMFYMRNFGHDGEEKFNGVGINGKNSEFHAAMGLCNMKYLPEIFAARKWQSELYDSLLSEMSLRKQAILPEAGYNYAYYPVIFENEEEALTVKSALEAANIFPRRYFYPSLSGLEYVERQSTPVSDSVSRSILCLPLYHDLSKKEQESVVKVLLAKQQYSV